MLWAVDVSRQMTFQYGGLRSFAAPRLNWYNADPTAVQWVVVKVRFVLFAAAA